MESERAVIVKVLFFAQSKELAGTREAIIQLPQRISYKELLNIITETYNLQSLKNNILLAKNEEVCEQSIDLEIKHEDIIAVIPPLSGG
ncbi:Molybdopterin synthase sulfur carrier subunit [Papilio machaon]|uniref:Molybdopterin synthase sulfur carrier subunit n=1 Tax=Papilio machaon TaxID=76193 RepID=A0A194RLX1_PAPMA|nr:Molybdopterin synthase sulfur carrier subunit [Papilio machaon]